MKLTIFDIVIAISFPLFYDVYIYVAMLVFAALGFLFIWNVALGSYLRLAIGAGLVAKRHIPSFGDKLRGWKRDFHQWRKSTGGLDLEHFKIIR